MWLKALVFTNKVKLRYISLRYLRNRKNLVISQSKKFTINKVAGLQFATLLVLESLFNKKETPTQVFSVNFAKFLMVCRGVFRILSGIFDEVLCETS